MTTLTYPLSRVPSEYEETKRHRDGFLKRAGKAYPGSLSAWILEFTKAGAAHYHIFWGGAIAEVMRDAPREVVLRSGHEGGARMKTEVIRGEVDARLVKWWTNQAGDGSPEFSRFQSGGITEVIRHPSGAARYAAKEAGKRTQKHAPFLVGQWWNISRDARPVIVSRRKVRVGYYVDKYGPVMMRHIFPVDGTD